MPDPFHHCVQRHEIALTQAHPVSVRTGRVVTDGDDVVAVHTPGLDALEGQVERHQLHQTRWRVIGPRILGEEGATTRDR